MILAAAFFMAGCQKKEENRARVYGVVTDAKTSEPIKGVIVSISNYQYGQVLTSTLTGSDGQYELLDVEKGSYSINADANIYYNFYMRIIVDKKNCRVDISLDKAIIKAHQNQIDNQLGNR